jgi:hypothetical protein
MSAERVAVILRCEAVWLPADEDRRLVPCPGHAYGPHATSEKGEGSGHA